MAKSKKTAVQSDSQPKTSKGFVMDAARAMDDFRWAWSRKKKLIKAQRDDAEFALGKQWETKDVEQLEKIGVMPLTINAVMPNINLLHGIEAQNRSDFKAFPEGKEDGVEAEIATGLLRNVMKNSDGDFKVSECFRDGNTVGESWLEPFLSWDDDLLNANLGLRKSDYCFVLPDPDSKEYDHSDGQFLCKVTFNLTRDQIVQLFPEKEDVIDEIADGRLHLTATESGTMSGDDLEVQRHGYHAGDGEGDGGSPRLQAKLYDLVEYYYKRYVDVWYIADTKQARVQKAPDKAFATAYVTQANVNDRDPAKPTATVFRKKQVEIWCMSILGGAEDEPMADERAWSFPKWRSWPLIPYYAYRSTIAVSDDARTYLVQGITRRMKDLNREKNKRRTQELRHLNQSANSGWLTEEDAWVDRDEVKEFGATPGVNLEYKLGRPAPQRIQPAALSMGHAEMAKEHSEDIKETLGINADLLALQDGGQASGRAIAIRQKQGLTMVQCLFDNLSRTKKAYGRFILSQMSELYTVETAMRVMGESFLQENFQKQVPAVDPRTGQPVIDPATGQPAMQVAFDQAAAVQMFNQVLSDTQAGNYDISVGEAVSAETLQYANFMTLLDMTQKGIPVPPEVLVDESLIDNASKEKIKTAIERQNAAAMAAAAQGGGKPASKPGGTNG